MKQDSQFSMNCVSANVDLMKVYEMQSKSGITMNVGVSIKNQMNWNSCKDDYTWNPSTCHCQCNKTCKNDKNLDIKNCSCKKMSNW